MSEIRYMARSTRKCFPKVLKSQVIKHTDHLKTDALKFFKACQSILYCTLGTLRRFAEIWMCVSRDITRNTRKCFLKVRKSQAIKLSHLKADVPTFFRLCKQTFRRYSGYFPGILGKMDM